MRSRPPGRDHRVATSIGATDSGVGGEAPALYDISAYPDSDLVQVIPIAILAIGLLLALVLRSLIAPLYLIARVPCHTWPRSGLRRCCSSTSADHGLAFLLPFLMFIFLLALGEDYNILVMTRIGRRPEAPARDAVSR